MKRFTIILIIFFVLLLVFSGLGNIEISTAQSSYPSLPTNTPIEPVSTFPNPAIGTALPEPMPTFSPIDQPPVENSTNTIDYNTTDIPIPDLGTDTYLGTIGGLYLNGSNNVPSGYANDAIADLTNDNDIHILCNGMSNMQHTCNNFIGKTNNNTGINPAVSIHNNGRPGRAQQAWDGGVNYLYTDLKRTGITPSQVDVIIYFNAWGRPSGDFESHYNEMYASLLQTINSTNAAYPNLKLIYVVSREFAPPWAVDLNPNPYAYEEGFAFRDIVINRIQENIGGVPILWGPYQYDPTWPDSYFRESDGVHLSDAGLDVAGQLWLDFFMTQSWFVDGNPLPTSTPQPTETVVLTNTPLPPTTTPINPTNTPSIVATLPPTNTPQSTTEPTIQPTIQPTATSSGGWPPPDWCDTHMFLRICQ